jgi:archaeal flagellar protein FlaI
VPLVERVQLPATKAGPTFGRRVKSLIEILDFEEYRTISEWDPLTDKFKVDLTNSEQLRRIALRQGKSFSNIQKEVKNRESFLRDLKQKGIKKNVDFKKQITNYFNETQLVKYIENPAQAEEQKFGED